MSSKSESFWKHWKTNYKTWTKKRISAKTIESYAVLFVGELITVLFEIEKNDALYHSFIILLNIIGLKYI